MYDREEQDMVTVRTLGNAQGERRDGMIPLTPVPPPTPGNPAGSGTATRGRRYVLLVIGEGAVSTHPLPDNGKVTVGRAAGNDVIIDDPSISRKHAILHIGPSGVRVEDLGSANGTRITDAKLFTPRPQDMMRTAELLDRRVEPGLPIPVTPDTVIKMGSVTLAVQSSASGTRPRRLWPHGYFEGCLEEECARAERSKQKFAVLRLRVSMQETNGPAFRSIAEEVLAEAKRTIDVVATYAPGEYELLLVDAEPPKAEEVKRRVLTALHDRGATATSGIAFYPQDGRAPETLLARANQRLEGEAPERTDQHELQAAVVVQDPAMQRLYALAERIADSTISVLVLGETGVGKEVLAETIHRLSPRRNKPFIKLNCASFTETLLESELFGHERGAFTGAVQAKQGLLEAAHGGTVFLDEVGELTASTQVKLLRVLEERKVLRVGSLKPKEIDVRFVAATNRDLEAEVAMGTFREDLFFRLNGIPLVIPPLRERPVEIEPLARALISRIARKANRGEPDLTPQAIDVLRRYSWPGNIRELRNVMERAVLLAGSSPISLEHLPVEKMVSTLPARAARHSLPPPVPPAPRGAPPAPPPSRRPSMSAPDFEASVTVPPPMTLPPPGDPNALKTGVEQVERDLIIRALDQCAGNQTQAAKLLGISRRTLVSRLEQYNLPRPRKPVDQR
jgi:DNA-binding NtrC family response regulator